MYAEAVADLHGLAAAVDRAAVELVTGLLRPLHTRAWEVAADDAG